MAIGNTYRIYTYTIDEYSEVKGYKALRQEVYNIGIDNIRKVIQYIGATEIDITDELFRQLAKQSNRLRDIQSFLKGRD